MYYVRVLTRKEILEYLLHLILKNGDDKDQKKNLINHKNHSGNTPLHWAALNTHLGCVKALVEAGADVSLKNDAGLDAVFLAERSAWDADADGEEGEEKGGDGQGEGDGEGDKGKMSPGREVVEWLLSCEEGKGGEEGEKEGGGEGNEK